MAEDFDRFIASALAPPERAPDRQFVAQIQAGIALERRLDEERRAMIVRLAEQLVGLLAVAAAVWLIGRTPLAAGWFAESPAIGLAALLSGFAFVVGVLSLRPDARAASFATI